MTRAAFAIAATLLAGAVHAEARCEERDFEIFPKDSFFTDAAAGRATLDVAEIASSTNAVLVRDGAGNLQAYGSSSYGSTIPESIRDLSFVSIAATENAFAAATEEGRVFLWTGSSHTGDYTSFSEVSQHLVEGVTQLLATKTAFAALKANGTLVLFGKDANGAAVASTHSGVRRVAASGKNFAALLDDGRVAGYLIENSDEPVPDLTDANATILSTGGAFAVQSGDRVVTFGDPSVGGATTIAISNIDADVTANVSAVTGNRRAFAALMVDATVQAWGDPNAGGDLTVDLRNVSSIAATDTAFAALFHNGSVYTWGDARYGGDTSTPQAPAVPVEADRIVGTSSAFAALRDGRVVHTWGSGYGGQYPSTLLDANTELSWVRSSANSFLGKTAAGQLVFWGAGNIEETIAAGEAEDAFSTGPHFVVVGECYTLAPTAAPTSSPTAAPTEVQDEDNGDDRFVLDFDFLRENEYAQYGIIGVVGSIALLVAYLCCCPKAKDEKEEDEIFDRNQREQEQAQMHARRHLFGMDRL